VSEAPVELRRLRAEEVARFQSTMPSWNAHEYAHRVEMQERGLAVQLVAWVGDVAAGRGMLVLAGHPEWSASAFREGCAEIRDVGVADPFRRRGIGSLVIAGLEREAADAGADRVGLSVALGLDEAPARALYEKLGYRFAHGPFVQAARLVGDDGAGMPVAGVCSYLVKQL